MSFGPEASREAARQIEREIEELTTLADLPGLSDIAVPFFTRRRDYKTFWEKVKQINVLFKGSRLFREDREHLWGRHRELCDEVKRLQDQEWRDREAASQTSRDRIWSELKSARPICDWADSVGELQRAEGHLTKAMELLNDKNVYLLREHREECWSEWKDLKRIAFEKRERLWGLTYETLRSEIGSISSTATYDDPHQALRDIKALQQRIRETDLKREQRQLLRDEVQPWWDKAVSRIEERREEVKKKQEEWRDRMETKRDRMLEIRERQLEYLNRLKDQIDDLEEQASSARTEEHAERVRGWIQQRLEKMEEVQRGIVELQEKISDVTERLRG